ncbi:hypothetical protein PR202_ga27301 [Eleusine coracana subsp. coracana]|uniref:Uncharacterized protein n=1 Tax=Eleusine coracana subsp. coracana TaxID=191504 RepID=A0AAV5DG55_ELECO|nr:hypothetical protein PR202_ga27301 [Eleusine coracana subsp. coracana]
MAAPPPMWRTQGSFLCKGSERFATFHIAIVDAIEDEQLAEIRVSAGQQLLVITQANNLCLSELNNAASMPE